MVYNFCIKCQTVLSNWTMVENFTETLRSQHHAFRSLEASANEGCQLCRLFLAGFSNDAIEILRDESECPEMSAEVSYNPHALSSEPEACSYLIKGHFPGYDTSSGTRIWTPNWRESRIKGRFSEKDSEFHSDQQESEPWTGCHHNLDLAKSWFTSCIKSHSDCLPENLKEFEYPTRLISIGSGILRLVLASEISHRAPYATLSHCWGGLNPLRLVNDNFTKLRTGISDSELCKTFNEAILVAKHLLLDYIWIDSLCIIQDDPGDWLRESAKMSGVYGGSTINIAATSAKDGTMGCFFKGAQAIRMPHPLGESRFRDFVLDSPFDTFLREPLLRRAWVFQERFLAPRTLHFTNFQIFWECREGQRCGMFPTRVFQDVVYWSGFPKSIPRRRHSGLWQNIVEIYSAGMLTNATDRLVAISGVARWLQTQYEDDYLAGIWRKDMEKQLCWHVKKRDSDPLIASISKPESYLAPSWSWASILNGVQFMETESSYWPTQKLLIRVLDAHTILENEDYKFGKVTGGALRVAVRYLLCGVECPPSPEDESGDISNSSGDTVLDYQRVVWDSPEDPGSRKKIYLLPVNSSCENIIMSPMDPIVSTNYRPGIDGWGQNLLRNNKPAPIKVDGIILEATETSKLAEYRRVGSWISGNGEDLEEKSDDLDESLYEEVEEHGTKLRVITII